MSLYFELMWLSRLLMGGLMILLLCLVMVRFLD